MNGFKQDNPVDYRKKPNAEFTLSDSDKATLIQEVQERYIRFKSNISNIYNHLIETLFNKNENLVFKENDFPYQFEDQENILHYLIWINPSNKKK